MFNIKISIIIKYSIRINNHHSVMFWGVGKVHKEISTQNRISRKFI